MLKKIIKIQAAAVVLFLTLAMADFTGAANFIKPGTRTNINRSTQSLTDAAGYETATADSALSLVQVVINIFLSVVGVLLLIYLLYAGYNWMTAQGEEEKVEKAKDTIKRAIVGLIIIIAAYAISWFVMTRIETNTLRSTSSGASATAHIG